MEQSTENSKPQDHAELEPWDGSLHIDPATVSRILESWEIFEEIDNNELPKKANT